MKTYAELSTDTPEEFKRLVGLSKENFQHLNSKLCAYISEQKNLSPLTRRGRKDSKLTVENRLLLTLYYLRHYPTLINLGAVFGISESYCHKVYSRTARQLADSGYQGMHAHHQNSTLPIKKQKGKPLSTEDKAHNKTLSKQRVFIEPINRRCKIFRIVKEVYR